MNRYKISGSYGYVGTDWEEEIEAASLEEAHEIAWEIALERVETNAELIVEDVWEEDEEEDYGDVWDR
jgi:hypothetical protein